MVCAQHEWGALAAASEIAETSELTYTLGTGGFLPGVLAEACLGSTQKVILETRQKV
jgi:hypothetical protein